MKQTFYITTPLYYVNAAPHIGHSYTTVAADCLARYHRLKGESVFFLTGTDEHGQKIEQAAAAVGKTPAVFVDEVVERFTSLWKLLNISHDDFIRTTQPRHVQVVQACLTRLRDDGKLHHATYQGWYCTPCETFWTREELADVSGAPLCPNCQRPLEAVTEEGWYLPLRQSQEWLTRFLSAHPTFIQPQTRFNEIRSLLEQPLPEYLCITRPRQRVGWGIPVPFSESHVTYVWFDALLNYISAPGYGEDPTRFAGLWPADVQCIGKDILRHHTIYWPIILHALGLPDEQMPRMIFAHGWWKIGEQKMSKSLGNIVDPSVVVSVFLKSQPYAADVYRYFLLREVPFGQDGNFSEDAIAKRLATDLANDLGNLVHRTLSMIDRYLGGKLPTGTSLSQLDVIGGARGLAEETMLLADQIERLMSQLDFSGVLERIMGIVSKANQYIEVSSPWTLAKRADTDAIRRVLSTLTEVIRIVAVALEPFMPSVSTAIWEQLGMGTIPRTHTQLTSWPACPVGRPLDPRAVLFPRAE